MSQRLFLPVDDWPEADIVMWQALVCSGDVFEDPGALSHLRETSQQSLRISYSRWLGWLNRQDHDALSIAPELRITMERLQIWLESELAEIAPMSQKFLIDDLIRVAKVAAPQLDWTRQMRLQAYLRKRAKRNYGARKTGRIFSSAVLFTAGLDLAGRLADEATTELGAYKLRRDGALIAFLALMPIRSRSLVELALETSIQVTPSALTVRLSGDMTKNGLPWEARVPDQLEPVLRQYVETVRPWFMNRKLRNHDVFWVIDCGRPFSRHYLGVKVRDVTNKLVGASVPPQFFRDAAATSLSRYSPENARLIRPLLGHASHGTAERHYIQARTIEAGRDYTDVLNNLKM